MKTKKTNTIKKISLLAVLATLICMSLAVSVLANEANTTNGVKGNACYTIGDVNGDGTVTKADAVYLLYHSLFGDGYELKQDGNFVGEDSVITAKDALALLFSIDKPAEDDENVIKEVHAYAEPIWTWMETGDGMSVSAAYKCACGEDEALEYAVVTSTKADATCTEAGSIVYTAVATHNGVTYETTKTVVVPATGHNIPEGLEVCEDKHCQNDGCEYFETGSAHTVDLTTPVQTKVAVEGKTCEYKNIYACSVCSATVDGPVYAEHDFKGTISKSATCKTKGEMLYTCTKCPATETKATEIDAEAHTWNEGEPGEGCIVYSCKEEGCTASKKTIKAVEGQAAQVSKTDLEKADEVEVNGTAIKMDQTVLEQLGGDVTIDAQKKTVSDVSEKIDPKDAEKIGNQPIYDFTLTSTAGNTSGDFGTGKLTVTIPYTLDEGEDPDCIDVWYIDDSTGEVTSIQGKYSNGYVTFETTHFSYYTVVRLKPAERCAKYGHTYTVIDVDPTCTTAGYERTVCLRCGDSSQVDEPALGHDYVNTTKAATCEEAGYSKDVCSRCKDTNEVIDSALGHAWGEATTVEPTCSSKGYQKKECANCDAEDIEYDATPIGHDYEAAWSWIKADLTAKVVLDCKRCDHSVTENAVVSLTKQTVATCAAKGETIYTAQVKVENVVYDDAYTIEEAQLDHKFANGTKFNSFYHYKECSSCGARVDEAEHELDDGQITAQASCVAEGVITKSCACGYTEEETIPALSHNIEKGKCTNCGFVASNCNHKDFTYQEVEFSKEDGYCGAWFEYYSCECGAVVYLQSFYFECALDIQSEVSKDANGNVKYNYTYDCNDCGLHVDRAQWFEVKSDCTGTAYGSYKVYDKNNQLVTDVNGIFYEDAEHPTCVFVSQEDLKKYGVCGGTATITKCLCGEYVGSILNMDCAFEYDEQNDYSVCKDCGVRSEYVYDEEKVGNCRYKDTYTESLYKGDTKLVSYVTTSEYTWHKDVDSKYELTGDTCSDGHKVIETCKECGHVESYKGQLVDGDHFYETEEEWDVSVYELCSPTTYKTECPCGEQVQTGLAERHYWWDGIDYKKEVSEDGKSYTEYTKRVCGACGLEEESTYVFTQLNDTCRVMDEWTAVYSKDGKEIITEHWSDMWEDHDMRIIDKKFEGDSQSCDDGVEITAECKKCGVVETHYPYWHREYNTAYFNAADYGMCDGYIYTTSCACGEEQNIYWDTACEWEHVKYDYRTQADIFKCSECGVERHQMYKTEVLENCTSKSITQYDFVRGADVIVSAKSEWTYITHDSSYEFVLDVPNGNCYDGYTVKEKCKNCSYTYSYHNPGNSYESHQAQYVTESYNGSDYGMCEGTIQIQTCPCEKEIYISTGRCYWMQTGYDEVNNTPIMRCSICGVTRTSILKYGVANGCEVPTTETMTFVDATGKEVLVISVDKTTYNHNYENKVVLIEGAKDCEDGVSVTATCLDCNYVNTYRSYWHETGTVSKYDLSEYGSVCGGYLVETACACGENYEVALTGKCQFGEQPTSPWVGESYGYQSTTEGWIEANPFASTIRCAVTSPACDLSIRTCTYYVWDKANCKMTEKEIWQLGYDSSSGTCKKELEFTTDEFAFHEYETSNNETDTMEQRSSICKNCQSSYVITDYYDANGHRTSYEEISINTLNNGETIERKYISTYQYDEVFDYNFEMSYSNEQTYSDGSVWWYRANYTYDTANCTRTRNESYSDGMQYVYTETFHPTYSDYVKLTEQSCTQQYRWLYATDCPVCNYYVVTDGPYMETPWGHNYGQNPEQQTYVCWECGLESANGADGAVVLEDMSDKYGNNTNYVIGYWDKSLAGFATIYVSVVDGENETILATVSYDVLTYAEDGICAISIDKAEVAAAMAEKELKGDIRVTFNPNGSNGDIDFAITLTE